MIRMISLINYDSRENSEVVIKFTQQQPWDRWDRAQPQMGSMLTADIGT